MARAFRETSKRLLSPNPESADEDQSILRCSPKRIKLSSDAEAREVRSPTPEHHSTKPLRPNESLRSPSPEASNPKSRSSSSRSLVSHSLQRHLREPKESQRLKSPTPDHPPLLTSPTPSPSKLTNMPSNRGPHKEIGKESGGDASDDSSSSRTLSASSESALKTLRAHPTWPVNTRIKGEINTNALPEGLIAIGKKEPSFCCADLKTHERTNPIMPRDLEKIHRPVIDHFIASIGPNIEELVTLPEKVFKGVDRIVKVNRVVVGTEISTNLYTYNEKKSTFTKFLTTSNVLLFNPQGKGSYQSYFCKTHRTMYRIGVSDKKFAGYKKRMSFGDIWIDMKMGLVSNAELKVEHFQAMFRDADPH